MSGQTCTNVATHVIVGSKVVKAVMYRAACAAHAEVMRQSAWWRARFPNHRIEEGTSIIELEEWRAKHIG